MCAVHDVAADQAELALEIERRVDLPGDHRRLEVGRVRRRPCRRSGRPPPRARRPTTAAVGQDRRELLAEQAGDVLARRREAVVDGRRDQHLDDRRASTSRSRLRVGEGAVHVVERRRDDDAALVVLGAALPGRHGEVGQLGQRDVHPEGARAGLEAVDRGGGTRPAGRPRSISWS